MIDYKAIERAQAAAKRQNLPDDQTPVAPVPQNPHYGTHNQPPPTRPPQPRKKIYDAEGPWRLPLRVAGVKRNEALEVLDELNIRTGLAIITAMKANVPLRAIGDDIGLSAQATLNLARKAYDRQKEIEA